MQRVVPPVVMGRGHVRSGEDGDYATARPRPAGQPLRVFGIALPVVVVVVYGLGVAGWRLGSGEPPSRPPYAVDWPTSEMSCAPPLERRIITLLRKSQVPGRVQVSSDELSQMLEWYRQMRAEIPPSVARPAR